MKKILSLLAIAAAVIIGQSAHAQAPLDLSFLTNRAEFASWMLKNADEIEVGVMSSASGNPEDGTPWTTKQYAYTGKPSLTGIAQALRGEQITPPTPIPDSITTVSISVKNTLPDGNKQYLLGGSASGRAEFDGENWQLPKEASEPPMYMYYNVFIPAPGVTKAWVVETNQWGWSVKKSLQVWQGQGFYFDETLCGNAFLCLEFGGGKGEESSQWVYNLHADGLRMKMPAVIAKISIRDSEDIRDFGDDSTVLSHWIYTFKPENSILTYGKAPLMVANYTKKTWVTLWVGSAVGYARTFKVTRIADGPGLPEKSFHLEIPEGQDYLTTTISSGLYHIVPLGIDVCADYWSIYEVDGWYDGGIGKGIAVPVGQ